MLYELYFKDDCCDSADNEKEFKETLIEYLFEDFDNWLDDAKNFLDATDIREQITCLNGIIYRGSIYEILDQLNDYAFGYSIVMKGEQ